MLAALLAGLFFFGMAGGGFALQLFAKDMQKSLKDVVTDEARADAAVGVVKRGRNDLEDLSKQYGKVAKGFRAADEDPSAGVDALTPFVDQAIALRRRGQAVVLDRIFELRGTLTESEWKAVLSGLEAEP